MRLTFPLALVFHSNPNHTYLLNCFLRPFSRSLPGLSHLSSRRPCRLLPQRFCFVVRPNLRGRIAESLCLSKRFSAESGLASSSPPVGRAMAAVAASMTEEAISPAKTFWLEAQKEAMLAKYTPFIVCLASGKLEQETFQHYIAQDVQFLVSFSSAYEKAKEYADDDDAKAVLSKLQSAILEELKMHNSVVQYLEVGQSEEVPPNPATVRYTNFLAATSEGKIEVGKGVGKIVTPFEKTKVAAYIVGAMVPCMRLYAFLGKELEPLLCLNGSSDLYTSWVKNYSPLNFEEAAACIEDLLDKLSVPLTGEELDVIQKLYHQAMKLEIDFFLAQPIVQPSVVPLSKLHDPKNRLFIFSDFDLTCTVLDSCAILAEIGIIKAGNTCDITVAADQMSSSELRNIWKGLSGQYTEEHEQCIESLLSSEEAKAFTPEDLCKRLEQLSDFEKRANSRVVESGVLKGMDVDDIKRAGEHLNLQDGCSGFFQKLAGLKETLHAEIHILSVCWSADLIRSAFASAGCIGGVDIHANELEYIGGATTGEIVRKMESPVDKVRVFRSITAEESGESVYIGDSVGDLLCLLEADIGIVLGSSESLRKLGKRFGISFVPLFEGLVHKQREFGADGSLLWKSKPGVLYTVSTWSEIQAFILGHEPS